MVSFWPWRSHDSSPASFEKTLSALANKIAWAQNQLERARAQGRRVKVLVTLYLGFAYVVYAVVLLLVVGWRNLGALEWTGLAGGPIVLYAVRAALAAVYSFRSENLSALLKEYQGERARTIQKLKEATRYDSTLHLLEKYGGMEGRPKRAGAGGRKKVAGEDEEAGAQEKRPRHGPRVGMPGRTNIPPPPTANIQPRTPQHQQYHQPQSAPHTPQLVNFSPPQQLQRQRPGDFVDNQEFAPNAFGPEGGAALVHQPPMPRATPETHWYDRILDTLLGEDETATKNRIVLICALCRQVNGQAPPGTKSLAELGIWRCMACGAKNGEMDEGEKIVRHALDQQQTQKDGHDDGRRSSPQGLVEGDLDEGSSDLVDVDKDDFVDDNLAEGKLPAEENVPKRKGRGKT